MNVLLPPNTHLRDVKMSQIPLLTKRGAKFYGHDGVWSPYDILPASVALVQGRMVFDKFPTGERCL